LKSDFGLDEAIILSTCNRVEVIASAPETTAGLARTQEFLSQFHQIDLESYRPHLYSLQNLEAVHHIFRVTSSLDSMMVGEPQILGQVKNAFCQAQSAGTLGGILGPLMNRAFFVAKRIRTETAIASSAVSISYAAVELARKIFSQLNDKTVLILGAGKMSELAVKHLAAGGISQVLVWNRTWQRAQELASLFRGEAIPPEELFRHIERADIIISSTGSPNFILKREDGERIIHLRKNRPVFIIDIAVPRDIDPEINKINNIFLYDIDDLRHVVDANRKQRMREAALAEEIVKEELEAFARRLALQEMAPAIVSLHDHWETIRREETAKFKKQMGPLTDGQAAALDGLTQSLLNKFLHGPIAALKTHGADPEKALWAEEIKKMLGLRGKK
jgi:glutamyl-tRNA reductase